MVWPVERMCPTTSRDGTSLSISARSLIRRGHASEHTAMPLVSPFGAPSNASPAHAWLVDTVCGHDLISRLAARRGGAPLRRYECRIDFNTAGCPTAATHISDAKVRDNNTVASPYILPSTPAALTVGRRRMEMGYQYA